MLKRQYGSLNKHYHLLPNPPKDNRVEITALLKAIYTSVSKAQNGNLKIHLLKGRVLIVRVV